MAIGVLPNAGDSIRPFRPMSPGHHAGGSKKGKPQGPPYPWLFKVVADAIRLRTRGSIDAALADRSTKMSNNVKRQHLDALMPGWEQWLLENRGARKTDYCELLFNRPYKGTEYSGSSDRGKCHDPRTRAASSSEDWRKHVPVGHPLWKLHSDIMHGVVASIPNWRELLTLPGYWKEDS